MAEKKEEERRPTRERKKAQKFTVEVKEVKAFTVPVGSGMVLKDMPLVSETLSKKSGSSNELSALHKVMYSRVGKKRECKKNILQFSGLVFSGSAADGQEKARAKIFKWSMPLIKNVMDLLKVNRSAKSFSDGKASKDNLVDKLLGWLESPTAPVEKPKKPKKPKAEKKPKKPKAEKKAKKPKVEEKPKAEKRTPAKRKRESSDGNSKKKRKKKTTTTKTVARKQVGWRQMFQASEFMLRPQLQKAQREKLAAQAKARKAKRSNKKKRTKKKKPKKKKKVVVMPESSEESSEEESSEESSEEEEDQDTQIKNELKKVMNSCDKATMTVKSLRKQVAKNLGVDLKHKKEAIKGWIHDML